MAKKEPKTEEQLKAEADAKAKAAAEKAAKKAEADAAKEAAKAAKTVVEFDPKKLQGVGHGVWKYSDEISKVSRETFQCLRAKDFGIKPNDVVFVSFNGEVEILGV